MDKIKVLFLIDDPFTRTREQLKAEILAIRRQLPKTEMLEFISAWALDTDDLRKEIESHQPHIVHFVGHGASKGIVLNVFNEPMPVKAIVLAVPFVEISQHVSLVIF